MSFGRLERTSSAQPMSDINMTPLVDVMLVLVVILIMTAPLLASAIKVDLPKAQGGSSAAPAPRAITLTLTAASLEQGKAFMNDEAVDFATLQSRLQSVAQGQFDTEVRLRADSTVAYGRVVEVMGVIHQAGLHRIGFEAKPH